MQNLHYLKVKSCTALLMTLPNIHYAKISLKNHWNKQRKSVFRFRQVQSISFHYTAQHMFPYSETRKIVNRNQKLWLNGSAPNEKQLLSNRCDVYFERNICWTCAGYIYRNVLPTKERAVEILWESITFPC